MGNKVLMAVKLVTAYRVSGSFGTWNKVEI